MNEVVLDSSVLLAVIRRETYYPGTLDLLEGATISAVNLAEIWSKLHELQMKNLPAVRAVLG